MTDVYTYFSNNKAAKDVTLEQKDKKDIISIRFPAIDGETKESNIVVEQEHDDGTYAVSLMLSKGYSTRELPASATDNQIIYTVLQMAAAHA
jgi:hypothetical protein